jgi:diguanylate cyclase (GGDEF)-like protein
MAVQDASSRADAEPSRVRRRAAYGASGLRLLRALHDNFITLIESLPPSLLTAQSHSVLLTHDRMRFLLKRVGAAAVFLAIATLAWIPIDILAFKSDWAVLVPLVAGRVVAGLAFLAVAGRQVRAPTLRAGLGPIVLIVVIGIAFFEYAHVVIAVAGARHLEDVGHGQYLVLPIALTAGVGIFPLTLLEAALVMAVPIAAFLIEAVHQDGGIIWLQLGGAVFAILSIAIISVVCAVSQLRLFIGLHEQSTVDQLTGAFSRRAGAELLDVLFARTQRSNSPLSLALLDFDEFKKVNDEFGHDAGDRLLREGAHFLRASIRRDDVLIRWGGEEFLVVFANTSHETAIELIVGLSGRGLGARPDGSVQTASVGLAERQSDRAQSWQELVELADRRMYAAKALGRARLNAPSAVSYRLACGVTVSEAVNLGSPSLPTA